LRAERAALSIVSATGAGAGGGDAGGMASVVTVMSVSLGVLYCWRRA